MTDNIKNKIIEEFTKGFSKEIYGREFAKKHKLNNKSVANSLNDLEKQGLLKANKKGRTKCFILNDANKLIFRYLVIAEINKSINFLHKYPKIREIFEKRFDKIVCIFGSYASGTAHKNSDLDVFVVGKINEKELKLRGKTYGIKVSVHSVDKKQFRNMLKNKVPLMNEIIKNHIVLSHYEEFISEVATWLI